MIIVGNSHVSMFVRAGRPSTVAGRPIDVVWVGQISVLTFQLRKPEAALARALFARHPGAWKLLVIGDLDVMWSLWRDSGGALDYCVRHYTRLFDELSNEGRFAWLVGPQVRHPLPGIRGWVREAYERHPPHAIWERARMFRARLGEVCAKRGIPVIDPTAALIDDDGTSRPGYFLSDDAHLRPEHVGVYLDEIRDKLGETLVVPPPPAASGAEPWHGSAARADLRRELARTRLREHVRAKLVVAGIDVEVDDDLDFGQVLDSLALVEVFTQALEVMGLDNTFDIDVREISTVAAMTDYLAARDTTPPA